MKRIKGYRFYVRLSPSQTRRRLRGHGLGVRKVETAGTGRALVIHTATGQHLRELESLFADVLETANQASVEQEIVQDGDLIDPETPDSQTPP